jgi:hypothetical protein
MMGIVLLAILVAAVVAIGAFLSGEDLPDVATPTTEPMVTSTTAEDASTTTTIGFETFTISGSGSETVTLQAPDDLATVLHITHEGEGPFSVTTLDSNSESIELLVDTEGSYEGSRAINLVLGDVISSIAIVADGDWSITATYLGALERSVDEAVGSGDAVVVMDITNPEMTVRHDGDGDFSVFMWTFESQGYVLQETGNVDTTVSVPIGGSVIEVEADGEWSLSTRG